MRLVVCFALSVITLSAGAAEARFTQSSCDLQSSGSLYLRLEAPDRRIRTLWFEPGAGGSVSFKGTTLSDLKWVAAYNSFKEFVLVSREPKATSGVLVLVAHNGTTKEIGSVARACWQRMESVVHGAVPTRVASGS
jgi:hypothetical protein